MISGPPATTVLDDVEFIQCNYREYFAALRITLKSDDQVIFSISPIGDMARYDIPFDSR